MTTTIRAADLIESVADALQFISYYHPTDYIRALGTAYEAEQSPAAKDAIAQILTNSRMCAEGHRPICQDTGIVNVFVKWGMDCCLDDTSRSMQEVVDEGVRLAYLNPENKLRASVLADPAFTMLLETDAARAIVTAAGNEFDGPLNVVGPGATTALTAIRRGHRLPLPLIGPEWWIARRFAHLTGTPIPDHVVEVLHRGRLADGRACQAALGWAPRTSATEIVDRLYVWPSVRRQPPRVAWEVA